MPRSRGGKNAWENLVWASKEVNTRKANRMPGGRTRLRLFVSSPRRPHEVPVTATLRNVHQTPSGGCSSKLNSEPRWKQRGSPFWG